MARIGSISANRMTEVQRRLYDRVVAAGPQRRYLNVSRPLKSLLQELGRHKQVRYVHLRRGSDSLLMQRGTVASNPASAAVSTPSRGE